MADLIIKPASIEAIKEVYARVLFSRTDLVTKISDGSVLNGWAFASSRLNQGAIKDVALAQSHFYPDAAHGRILDNLANFYGVAPRFSAIGSSTYVRIVGASGTTYTAGTQTFLGDQGVVFDLAADVTIGDAGYAYALVSSQGVGSETNIDPLDINRVTPIPTGHQYVTNEFKAIGGRDDENDDAFRERIKNAINQTARPTISYLTQAAMKIDPRVMRLINYGTGDNGQVVIAVVTQNGAALSANDLESLAENIRPFLTLTEINPNGFTGIGVEFRNVIWQEIDISCRVRMKAGFNVARVRREMQIRMNKYLDYRYWTVGQLVEWDDLLEIAKTTKGIDYVLDSFFYPNVDVLVNYPQLPRIRGFLMLDEGGDILSDGTVNLNPTFFPSIPSPDFAFQANTLANL
jgi:uncharacterized phage protein gp47/JayE